MGKLRQIRAHVVGIRKDESLHLPTDNHFKEASISPKVLSKLARAGFTRAAGNVFLCKSTKDLWKVRNGKIVRLTKVEVDHGDSIAAPTGDPNSFLIDALNDLTF